MKKPNFSIALISRNESKTLPRLIGSLKEFQERGGKIYLADTGSTDGTAEIARKLGCEVYECGDQFRKTIDKNLAKQINERFCEGDPYIVNEGDTLFDYSSARNWIAEKSETDWVFSCDCDEVYTTFDIDKLNEATTEPGVDGLSYDFVFAHDQYGEPTVQFLHSKVYKKSKQHWVGTVHEILQDK